MTSLSMAMMPHVVTECHVTFSRRRKTDKDVLKGRSVMARSASSKAILSRDISMSDLNDSEALHMNDRKFSELSDDPERIPIDLEDGSFMVDNQRLSPKKQDQDYMNELESSSWYHGSISRSKAEELLDDGDNEGSFVVRKGLDKGEFYISVRAPDGGPKFRHIAVNRHQNSFVAVCGPKADAMEFTTFHELIEYLRSSPTHVEGVAPDVVLRNHVENVSV